MISDYLLKLNCFEHLAFGERDDYVYIESVCVTGCHYWNVWCAVLGLTVNWFNTQPCSLPSPSLAIASRYLPSLLGAAASVETEHWPPPRARQWTVSSFVRGAETASRISILIDCMWNQNPRLILLPGTFLWKCWRCLLRVKSRHDSTLMLGTGCQLSTCCAIVYFCKSQCLEICRAFGLKSVTNSGSLLVCYQCDVMRW